MIIINLKQIQEKEKKSIKIITIFIIIITIILIKIILQTTINLNNHFKTIQLKKKIYLEN